MLIAELLERVSEDSVEYRREIIHVIEQSYKDPASKKQFIHARAFRVHNSQLLNEVSFVRILMYYCRHLSMSLELYFYVPASENLVCAVDAAVL